MCGLLLFAPAWLVEDSEGLILKNFSKSEINLPFCFLFPFYKILI